jgi:hypothetical protein
MRADRVGSDDQRDGRCGRGVENRHDVRHHGHADRHGKGSKRSAPTPAEAECKNEAGRGGGGSFTGRVEVCSDLPGRVRGIDRPELDLEEGGQADRERPVAGEAGKPRERHKADGSALPPPLPRPRERFVWSKNRSPERREIAIPTDDAEVAAP